MKDFDVTLGMDFLGKDNVVVVCRQRKVTFKSCIGEEFMFKVQSLRKPKMISDLQARMMLTNACMGFLASIVYKSKDEKLEPKDVLIVREFIEVFPNERPRLPPEQEISVEIMILPGVGPISKLLSEWPQQNSMNSIQLEELLDIIPNKIPNINLNMIILLKIVLHL